MARRHAFCRACLSLAALCIMCLGEQQADRLTLNPGCGSCQVPDLQWGGCSLINCSMKGMLTVRPCTHAAGNYQTFWLSNVLLGFSNLMAIRTLACGIRQLVGRRG